MKWFKSREERYEFYKTMTHEQRLACANKFKSAGMGLIVAGIGCFAGLTGGLWGTMGAGALGVASGSASGLTFASCSQFRASKEILEFDEEIEQENLIEEGRTADP